MKTHKLYIIKKRSNSKVWFVEFIFNSRQFKLKTTGSQLHGARWPRFNCVQMIETIRLAAAVAKKMIMWLFCCYKAARYRVAGLKTFDIGAEY